MIKDVKYATRMLVKNAPFTAVAICSLAIGIGANSAIFSFADALLLRPLPIPKPGEFVTVNPGVATTLGGDNSVSYPDYVDFRDRNRSFTGLVAYQYQEFGYAPNSLITPEMKFGALVSGNFFDVLAVKPELGRGFLPGEDKVPDRDRVAVLSHDFWVANCNSAASVVGSTVRLDGMDFTVVGVAPASFTGMDQFVKPALFVPIAMSAALSGTDNLNKRETQWLNVKGRLKPGVTNAAAAADLNAIAKALQQTYPTEPRDRKIRVQSELALRMEQSPPDTGLVEMLILLAICVLLVACANVAGLLLSRATSRGREVAVRLAVGAARWQLLRQLFVENTLIALGGAVFGILVALAGMRLLASIPIPSDLPLSFDISLDRRVLLFTLLITVASTFLFGLVPAWRSSRSDLISSLRARDSEATRTGRRRGRSVLVSAQLAVSLVLLIASAVIFTGFRKHLAEGPGYQTDHLYLMSFDPQLRHYTAGQSEQFYKQLLDGSRANTAVRSAALASSTPFGFGNDAKAIIPEGRTLQRGEHAQTVFDAIVSDGYFETMHIPMLRGRGFEQYDKKDSPRVAIINEQTAKHFWPHEDALGKRFHLNDANGPLLQIVGIAKQAKYLWISEAPLDFLYLPFSQNQQTSMTLIAESPIKDASMLAPILRGVVQNIDRNMPAFEARTMQDMYSKRAIQTPGIIVQAVASMGVMALILAVIGLYGLISYSVARRTREIGIRMAIGADQRNVLGMILREGFVLAGCGTLVGLGLGVVAARLIGSTFIVSSQDANPALFVLIALPLLLVALLATYAPARTAARIDPMRSLREE